MSQRSSLTAAAAAGASPGGMGRGRDESEDQDHHAAPVLRRRTNKTAKENAGFFAVGRELESATVNHQFTADEKKKLAQVESIDYLPPNSRMYRAYLWANPSVLTIHWARWLMMGSIGFCVGFTGYCLRTLTELIATAKFHVAAGLIDDNDAFSAYVWVIVYSVVVALIASAIVVFFAPAAAGSGIPEVIGYLNGCNLPQIFNIRTIVAKFTSAMCAVGSGLPVGPEGPMIHLGAMLGAGISQGRSRTLGLVSDKVSKFRNSKDRRDFITAGAAAGVATAFGAPVGGLLFGLEEVASFWDQALIWQMFFACMTATFTIDLFQNGAPNFIPQASFGAFKDSSILFLTKENINSNLFAFIPAIIIGAIGGLLGAIFTFLNLKIARFRRRAIVPHKWKRMAEVALIMFLYGTLTFLIPFAFECSSIDAAIKAGMRKTLFDCKGESRSVCESEAAHVTPFFCVAGNGTNAGGDATQYNHAASLMFTSADNGIHILFSRSTPEIVGAGPCMVMFVVFFLGACWAAGSGIASGLVVPMLMIGACYGRAIGLGIYHIMDSLGADMSPGGVLQPNGELSEPGYFNWVDPGVMALLGAAGFFGGVSRLTISLTVILMEITNDIRLLLPLMASIISAKTVADLITHSLYHALLEMKCVPFLPPSPAAAVSLELFQAKDVMTSPVVCLSVRSTVKELLEVLKQTTHHTFPVVDAHPDFAARAGARAADGHLSDKVGVGTRGALPRQVLLGSLSREVLEVLLEKWMDGVKSGAPGGDGGANSLTFEELVRRDDERHRNKVANAHKTDYEEISSTAAAVLGSTESTWVDLAGGATASAGGAAAAEAVGTGLIVNLERYVNQSQHTVSASFSLDRMYILFRSMGLRALMITDTANSVVGIVTRKDLLGYRVEECIEPILEERGLIGEHTKFAGGHKPGELAAHGHGHGHGH